MIKTVKLFNVTRWCCTSGDCIDCHERRDHGEAKAWPHEAARVRIVQGKDLTREQAEKYFKGWNCHGYEPKIEEAAVSDTRLATQKD